MVGDGDGTGTDDDRVDVHFRACARRLVNDGLQCDDNYLLVKMMMMVVVVVVVVVVLLFVLVMSAGPYVEEHVYLRFRVRVNTDENVWTEMR